MKQEMDWTIANQIANDIIGGGRGKVLDEAIEVSKRGSFHCVDEVVAKYGPLDKIEHLLKKDHNIRAILAGRSVEFANRLINDDMEGVRAMAASLCDDVHLDKLSDDKNFWVQLEVAKRGRPQDIYNLYKNGFDIRDERVLRERPKTLFPDYLDKEMNDILKFIYKDIFDNIYFYTTSSDKGITITTVLSNEELHFVSYIGIEFVGSFIKTRTVVTINDEIVGYEDLVSIKPFFTKITDHIECDNIEKILDLIIDDLREYLNGYTTNAEYWLERYVEECIENPINVVEKEETSLDDSCDYPEIFATAVFEHIVDLIDDPNNDYMRFKQNGRVELYIDGIKIDDIIKKMPADVVCIGNELENSLHIEAITLPMIEERYNVDFNNRTSVGVTKIAENLPWDINIKCVGIVKKRM